MKPLFKVLKLDKYSFYETHLALINCILPVVNKMTQMEIRVLARFMALEGDISSDRFGESARKIIKKDLNLSAGGLSNYMRAFRDKSILDATGQIRHIFFPTGKEQIYNFKLILNETAN